MSGASVWQLAADHAFFACGGVRATLALDGIGTRLVVNRWRDEPVDDLVLFGFGTGVAESPSPQLAESYVRGADLFARYAPIPPSNIAPEIYWRAALDSPRDVVRIEFILSLHTDLLDSRPDAVVMTLAQNASIYHVADLTSRRASPVTAPFAVHAGQTNKSHSLLLIRNKGQRFSYAQMAHPMDFVSTALIDCDPTQGWHLFHTKLLAERLEKGVIRRTRICGWFLPAENDLALAVELARQFIDEPLPLTT